MKITRTSRFGIREPSHEQKSESIGDTLVSHHFSFDKLAEFSEFYRPHKLGPVVLSAEALCELREIEEQAARTERFNSNTFDFKAYEAEFDSERDDTDTKNIFGKLRNWIVHRRHVNRENE